MPIIPLKCPNCGGDLQVSSEEAAFLCPYCNVKSVFKDAIVQNYVQNTIQINAGAVTLNTQKDFEIEAGVLKKYHGESADVSIPDNVNEIHPHAFEGLKVRNVIVPKTVTRIGYDAFWGCSNLKSIELPEGLTNIDGAFTSCGLISVTVPPTVKRLVNTFSDCTHLVSVHLPESITQIDGAFQRCSGLTSIAIPKSVVSFGSAFLDCVNLKTAVISNGIKEVGVGAFKGCANLSTVLIPSSVTKIGGGAFDGCSALTSIHIPDGVKTIDNYAFRNCTNLSSVTIPSSVTKIGASAFAGCSKLTFISIPNSVSRMEASAFCGCSSLTDVELPEQFSSEPGKYFAKTPYLTVRTMEKLRQEKKCPYCGGQFKGLFKKRCGKCGKLKDY